MKAILFSAALLPCAAHAQQPHCDQYPAIAEALSIGYGESVTVRGLAVRGHITEWWSNRDTGTWTIVALDPSGLACIVDAGQAYETVEPAALGIDG